MKEWYSLLECAKILHLTKNTIKYRVSKLPPEQVKQENGKWYIARVALESMEKFSKAESNSDSDNQSKNQNENQSESKGDSSNHDLLVEVLKNEVEDLKKQMAIKDREISELHQLLAREQDRTLAITDNQKPNWWQRTFGKRESKVDSVN